MPHLVIAVVGSLVVLVLAAVASVPTYRVAPAFLIPAIWAAYFLRRRLYLRPLHYALLASAIVLHMLGAFGFYQRWPLPVSFDVVVHYWFALVVTLVIYRALDGNYPLPRAWHAYVLAFFLVMGLAALHEVMEYGSYLLLGEEKGMLKPTTSYFFDTSRDLTSNLFGTLTALAAIALATSHRRPSMQLPSSDDHGRDDASAPTPLRSRPMWVVCAMIVIAVVYLRWQGRVWWCAQGDAWPVSLKVDSPHNSQHLLDPYSLSHVLHGILFYGVLWLARRRLSLGVRAAIAAGVEIAWEILENSPIVINRYRTATIALGYTGDAILNSLSDIASFGLGFYVARKLGLWWSIVIFLATEVLMLLLMRDNLTLNVMQLLWPIDAVRKWQSGG